jgi:N,N'-diacetyllegionaminate synthase
LSVTIIAEAGVNHDGSLEKAFQLVRAARASGADIVKFQHFRTDEIVAQDASTAAYQSTNTGLAKQHDLLRDLEIDLDGFARIAALCSEEGIGFLCTAFDVTSATELVALGMPAMKIPSGELTNLPMLRSYASFGLPVWLSTGMGTEAEVVEAVETLENAGARDITIMHCTSLYPAPPETLNLSAIATLARRFECPVGFSDHSLDDHATIAAVALGATLIEKHFTLDCTAPGPDHRASLEPAAFSAMVRRIRDIALMKGDGIKRPHPLELNTASVARRSWHATLDLPAGHILRAGDVALKRPATGLAPSVDPLGRQLLVGVAAGTSLRASDLK